MFVSRLGGLFFLLQLLLAALGDGVLVALFTGYKLAVDEEVPNRFRTLGTFGEPVFDAFLFDFKSNRIFKRVVGSKDFQSLSPWITGLFRHDEAVLGLLRFPDTGEADG